MKQSEQMGRLEILAPAGGPEALTAAVRAGADAVYLGASEFSARSSAHNFDRAELEQAVGYCHENGVKVHLAVNTLVHDNELEGALRLAKLSCRLGIDALIMQDVGLISLIRKAAPEMQIHASTQMSVHTPAGVKRLADMGFSRAVLSRELSFEEIKEIAEQSTIELEVFVHGALCMSVSGQCYLSAMLGSRSGNRGSCAQPCRLPFSVPGGTGHDLSLKDLSVITKLRELEKIGVASAKIEGRMKRPEYVAAAVAACRQSLDEGAPDDEAMKRLEAVFSRSGFTQGYYDGRRGAEMFGIRSKENVQSADSRTFAAIHELYKRERQRVPVDMSLTAEPEKQSTLTVCDDDGNTATVSKAVPEAARTVALDCERSRKSLEKTGGTPYYLRSLSCDIKPGLSLPASALNAMRNDCLRELSQKRRIPAAASFEMPGAPEIHTRNNERLSGFRARFMNDDIPDSFLDCELVYVPVTLSSSRLEKLMDRGFAVAVELPRGMFGLERSMYAHLRRVQQLGINEVLANNIGAVEMASSLGMDIHGGFGLNLTNTASVEWAQRQGFLDAEVSFELTLEQIAALGGKIPLGMIVSGRLPLMLMRNCPAKNDGRGCKHCKSAPYITDRKGIRFPMQCYGSCTELLNSVPLSMSDRLHEICGISFGVLRFSVEEPEKAAQIYETFRTGTASSEKCTRGLYYRASLRLDPCTR